MALIGDPTTLTDSSIYFAANDMLTNHWAIDIRPLNFKRLVGRKGTIQEDEVSGDGEGKIKDPFY